MKEKRKGNWMLRSRARQIIIRKHQKECNKLTKKLIKQELNKYPIIE